MSSVQEMMHEPVLTAAPDERVDSVVRRMCTAEVGAVLVVEDGKLRGIFSERDLLARVVGGGRNPSETRVGEVSTEKVVTVAPSASIRECAEALRSGKIRHLPVVDDGKPVGIVSARDFFEKVAGELETLIDRLRYDAELHENEDPYDHFGGSYGR